MVFDRKRFLDSWWQYRNKLDLKSHFPGDLTRYLPVSSRSILSHCRYIPSPIVRASGKFGWGKVGMFIFMLCSIMNCTASIFIWIWISSIMGLPRWFSYKRICLPNRRHRFDPWVWKIPLDQEMAIHSTILAWEIPGTEEPGGLQSMGLQRVGHDLVTKPPTSIIVVFQVPHILESFN